MHKRFVCGVTVYRPGEDVVQRIKNYTSCFETVYIYDNTETENLNADLQKAIKSLDRVVYIGNGENKGLPYAFNRIIENTSPDMDYICTLDQDSVFPIDDIQAIENKISALPNNSKYGIIAPHILYDTTDFQKKDEIIPVRYVITSGSFVSLHVLRNHNIKYDEAYFIDKFEIDLGEQIKREGYIVAQYYGSVLHQRLGELDSKGRRNHSALRHYYLFRNRFYFNKKFYSFPKRGMLTFLQTVNHMRIVTFHEENSKQKLKMLPKAYSDYKHNRLGKKPQ